MPPAIDLEDGFREEEELEHQDASSSDPDEMIDIGSPFDADFPEETFYSQQPAQLQPDPQPEIQQDPQRYASPVPIVVSDIIMKNATDLQTAGAALPKSFSTQPPKLKKKTMDERLKRTRPVESTGRSNAKRRRGNRRRTPCVYCVRRIANDPSWWCHDAVVGQSGTGPYVGTRCSECVFAHVSCHLIPDKAIEAVDKLTEAAADAVASEGVDKIPLLAAYEAAIGPALRAIIILPKPHKPKRVYNSSTKQQPLNNNSQWPSRPSSKRPAASSGPSAWQVSAAPAHQSFASSSTSHQQQYDPASFFAPPSPPSPQQQQQQQQQQQNGGDDGGDAGYDKLERQALRRRKVEALESISHTAALFLAEFMMFVKHQQPQQQSSASSLGGGGGGAGENGGGQYSATESVSAQNHGVNYAAVAARMAASMFQPLANGDNADGDDGRDSDCSDASTIENNVHPDTRYQSFVAEPASAQEQQEQNDVHQGGVESRASFGSDIDGPEDGEDARASTKREEDGEGEERQRSEVKMEDE